MKRISFDPSTGSGQRCFELRNVSSIEYKRRFQYIGINGLPVVVKVVGCWLSPILCSGCEGLLLIEKVVSFHPDALPERMDVKGLMCCSLFLKNDSFDEIKIFFVVCQ